MPTLRERCPIELDEHCKHGQRAVFIGYRGDGYVLEESDMDIESDDEPSATDLADALNADPNDPWWADGFVTVGGHRLDIDYDASDALCARLTGLEMEAARATSQNQSRWMVAGGLEVEYIDGRGWVPTLRPRS